MFGLEESEWIGLALTLKTPGVKHRKISPCVAAKHLDKALRETTWDHLAEALGFADSTTIKKVHSLCDLDPPLAALVSWGGGLNSVSMSCASQLMRLKDKAAIEEGLKAAVTHRFTKEESRNLIQVIKRAEVELDIKGAIERVLKGRPQIEHLAIIVGTLYEGDWSIDLGVEEPSEVISLGQSAIAIDLKEKIESDPKSAERLLKLSIIRKFPDITITSVRLNDGHYSLMFTADSAAAFKKSVAPRSIDDFVKGLVVETFTLGDT